MMSVVGSSDATIDAIAEWCQARDLSDEGETFVHGNFRLDNIHRIGERLGFLDFENRGTGSRYQDLSRPVSDLLLTQATVMFPLDRARNCVESFLKGYKQV